MFRLNFNRINRLARKTLISVFSLAFAAMSASAAFAYTTESFDVDVTVNEDNSYDFSETIKVNFDRQKHGIYVYIPESGMEGINTPDFSIPDQRATEISDEWVKDWNYEVYSDNGCTIFQIGDGDSTVIGEQTYELGYRMTIVDDKDTTKDFMYIDLLPTGWETAIDSTTIHVTMPKEVDPNCLAVYSGSYGFADTVSNVSWECSDDGREITITGENLVKGQGITIFAELPEGYWQGQLSYDGALSLIPILCVLFAAISAVLWLFFGRDEKIIPTVEFYPPEGLTPAEVGLIADGNADKGDLLSLIIYFADKGELAIEQLGKKKFALRKLKEIDPKEKKFARILFEGLFEKGDYVKLDDLGESFGDAYIAAQSSLTAMYQKSKNRQITVSSTVCRWLTVMGATLLVPIASLFAGVYSGEFNAFVIGGIVGTPMVLITLLLIISTKDKEFVLKKGKKTARFVIFWGLNLVAVLVTAVMLYVDTANLLCAGTFVLCEVICELAACMMEKRTPQSAQLMGKILGLKNFIETAEADRINALVEENPSYFYNILPYAYVLGVTDKWAKNFENINIEKPSWYYGDSTDDVLFNAWFYSSMMRNCSRAVASNIKIVADSIDAGGGGFSPGGGGFTGGGFGGGGGGSW